MKSIHLLFITPLMLSVCLLQGCGKNTSAPKEHISFKVNGQLVSYPYCKIQRKGFTAYYGLYSYELQGAPEWENRNPAGDHTIRLTIHDKVQHTSKIYTGAPEKITPVDVYIPANIEYLGKGALPDYLSLRESQTNITIKHINAEGNYIQGEFEGTLQSRTDDNDYLTITEGKFVAVSQ